MDFNTVDALNAILESMQTPTDFLEHWYSSQELIELGDSIKEQE